MPHLAYSHATSDFFSGGGVGVGSSQPTITADTMAPRPDLVLLLSIPPINTLWDKINIKDISLLYVFKMSYKLKLI